MSVIHAMLRNLSCHEILMAGRSHIARALTRSICTVDDRFNGFSKSVRELTGIVQFWIEMAGKA